MKTNDNYSVQVKVIDNAGNERITKAQEVTIGEVTTAEGNLELTVTNWNSSTHKATVGITKGSSIGSELTVQYQVVSSLTQVTESGWTTGTSVSGVGLNEYVCARLWDGNNGGSIATLKVSETSKPQAASIGLSATSTTTVSDTKATVTLADNESGVNVTQSRYVYTETAEALGTANTSKYTQTFKTNPETITLDTDIAGTYYLHVLTVDNAGNATETISEPIIVKEDRIKILVVYDVGYEAGRVANCYTEYFAPDFLTVDYNNTMTSSELIASDYDVFVCYTNVWTVSSWRAQVINELFAAGKNVITIGNDTGNNKYNGEVDFEIIGSALPVSWLQMEATKVLNNTITKNMQEKIYGIGDEVRVINFKEGVETWYTTTYNGTEYDVMGCLTGTRGNKWFHCQLDDIQDSAKKYLMYYVTGLLK